jgi:GT2 family glycosyltransferase
MSIKILTKMQPSVAIIVLNFNGFNDSIECIESIEKTNYDNYKIILVDNGSDNDEGFRIKKEFPDVILIQNSINRGFSGGNNDGIKWAIDEGFDYIVNLNNDCIVDIDWLSNLVQGVLDGGVDFASSRIMCYPEKEFICSDGDDILPDGGGIVFNYLKLWNGNNDPKKIFSACGAASIFSYSCLKAIQLFNSQYYDELYFCYLEDIDLGIRLNARSFKGIYVPTAIVYHKESKTAGYRSPFKIFHVEKNRILNELLNYPVILIFMGELYYLIKTFLKQIKHVLKHTAYNNGWLMHSQKIDSFSIWVKSRIWILKNLKKIFHDRKERQKRLLINFKILKKFRWNLFKAL